jgi:hypothetical protein
MKIFWCGLYFVLIVFTPILSLWGNNTFSEYWQRASWEMWRLGRVSSAIYAEIRTHNHMKNIRLFQISEQLAYHVSDQFRLEVHYTYINSRSVFPGSLWRWQHRFEFEANRDFLFENNVRVITRNRFEIKREQRDPKTEYRFRQRTWLRIPIENCGKLKAYSMINEVFYNILTHYIYQDRVTPVNLTFELAEKFTCDMFFMVQFYTGPVNRGRAMVLGSQFNF